MKFLNLFFVIFNYLIFFGLKIRITEGIIGGHDIPDGEFKYHVAIRKNNGLYVCGGAIIGEQHVITAAQCIMDKNNKFIDEKFIVSAGVSKLDSDYHSTIVIPVEISYVPSEFKQISCDNPAYREEGDVAVLKLLNKLPLKSKLIEILSLPKKKAGKLMKYMSQNAVVTGFGINTPRISRKNNKDEETSLKLSNKLQFALTTIRQLSTCNNMWNDCRIREVHLCAQVIQPTNGNSAGVCDGDIGAPLVIGNVLVGILVNMHSSCNEDLFAGVYTRISEYIQFITEALKNIRLPNMRIANYRSISVIESVTTFSELFSSKSKP